MMRTSPQENEQYYLAHWMSGKLTDAELLDKVGPAAFSDFELLRDSLRGYQVADADLSENYRAIKQKKAADLNQVKVRRFPWYGAVAVAASLLLMAGIFRGIIYAHVKSTTFGQVAHLTLPDESKVTLSAQSQISYASWFAVHRNIKLEGQAYFEVRKGSTFTVETAQGKVQVLGTHFSVASTPSYFEVNCYEGRVKVTQQSKSNLVNAGTAIRYYRDGVEKFIPSNLEKPEWLQNTTSFKNAPLEFVFTELTHQYGKKIVYPEALKSIRFTGSFTHSNLNTALQSICIPMQKTYRFDVEGNILILE